MSVFAGRAGFVARCLTVLGTALAAAGLADPAAQAALTCNTPGVALYHVDALSQLRRWTYSSPLGSSSTWTQQLIGTGWSGLSLVSGGGGVLYAIDPSGNLRWYKDLDYAGGAQAWDPASGSVIGAGWNGFSTVISGGGGVIYAVDSSGKLHWYRHLGSGSSSWAPNSGTVIGAGWNGASKLVAGGAGVLYTVSPSSVLSWYRHQDALGGTASWASGGVPSRIGSGWSAFTGIESLGGGVLFAWDATGRLVWYLHNDPLGGSASWANAGVGVTAGTGWNDNPAATDITGCSAP
ncbi:MAG TPA: tachylectin-related carbohydrate-binding protein [Actinocrinis sp.]|nr:tachylectin-related carbohydrate-binding protein [Actinocrinis sp.]